MEKQIFTVGERVDKLCAVCKEERGHIVASVTKVGNISRVRCPKCDTISTFKISTRTALQPPAQSGLVYDRARTYRAGQTMTHPTYGQGEVTSLIEPQKIDVLFADKVRRLIHARI
jgi:ssDNA-binding Zn-finger/Zn-ribbon topoisomerase 1